MATSEEMFKVPSQQIGNKRYAVVSQFKGMILVSIREYYDAEGDLRPTKKGISLKISEWQSLVHQVERIDSKISELDDSIDP
jgi:hypothetical protein